MLARFQCVRKVCQCISGSNRIKPRKQIKTIKRGGKKFNVAVTHAWTLCYWDMQSLKKEKIHQIHKIYEECDATSSKMILKVWKKEKVYSNCVPYSHYVEVSQNYHLNPVRCGHTCTFHLLCTYVPLCMCVCVSGRKRPRVDSVEMLPNAK